MRLRNQTDMPDDVVRAVLAFVAPPGVRRYDVRIKNCGRGAFKGWAYVAGSSRRAERARVDVPYVILSIGPPSLFPRHGHPSSARRTPSGRGYLAQPPLGNRTEALVYLAAHELRHLWQMRVPRGRRVWGARGQFSERDCDAYAIQMLRRWRREAPTVRALGWYLPEPPARRRRRATTTTK